MYEINDLSYPIESVTFDIDRIEDARSVLRSSIPDIIDRKKIPFPNEATSETPAEQLCEGLDFARIGDQARMQSIRNVKESGANVRPVTDAGDETDSWRHALYEHAMRSQLQHDVQDNLSQTIVADTIRSLGFVRRTPAENITRIVIEWGTSLTASQIAIFSLANSSAGLTEKEIFLAGLTTCLTTLALSRLALRNTRFTTDYRLEALEREGKRDVNFINALDGSVLAIPAFTSEDPFTASE